MNGGGEETATTERIPAFAVRRGRPTDEELAAVLAVVGEAYASESSTSGPPVSARSRWELSARGLRASLPRERGWGGFSG